MRSGGASWVSVDGVGEAAGVDVLLSLRILWFFLAPAPFSAGLHARNAFEVLV